MGQVHSRHGVLGRRRDLRGAAPERVLLRRPGGQPASSEAVRRDQGIRVLVSAQNRHWPTRVPGQGHNLRRTPVRQDERVPARHGCFATVQHGLQSARVGGREDIPGRRRISGQTEDLVSSWRDV